MIEIARELGQLTADFALVEHRVEMPVDGPFERRLEAIETLKQQLATKLDLERR